MRLEWSTARAEGEEPIHADHHARFAVAWVLARVNLALVGVRSSADIASSAAAADIDLSEDELTEIEHIASDGVQTEGASPAGVA